MTKSINLDGVIARLLLVTPQPQEAAPATRMADRVIGGSLLFSALRCTIQYIVLPILLPLLGIAASLPRGVMAVFDCLVVIALISTLRRLWRTRHPRRWDYLVLAILSASSMIVFLMFDLLG